MRSSPLARRLALAALLLVALPALAAAALYAAARRGDAVFLPGAALGLLAATAGVGLLVYAGGRSLLRRLAALRLATELAATVNPDHRIDPDGDDEVGALAAEIARLAGRLREARGALGREVAEATRRLAEERGKLRAVLEAIGEGVLLATPDGRIGLANRAAHALLGAAGGGLLGRSLFELVDPEKVALFLARLGDGLGAPERFTLEPAGGGPLLEAVATPFAGDDGRPTGFVLVLRDVTRPAQADEARRRRLADTLEVLRGSLASVRSLAENLLADPALLADPGRPLLRALHAEALRLAAIVAEAAGPGGLGLAPPPDHFERLPAADLLELVLRRLERGGRRRDEVRVERDPDPL
ncbi:MAG TPA: PAS domain-containing protein, partial [Thermodesulfobacteriota bacterium]|nr:PAS domain-containing protein [Thermodesulfobacteriota bacterium]